MQPDPTAEGTDAAAEHAGAAGSDAAGSGAAAEGASATAEGATAAEGAGTAGASCERSGAGDVCSPIESAMGVLGRAWAGAVLRAMLEGADRFTDIRRAVPGISDAVLSARLRELCQRGFAERRVDSGPPVSVHYRLTDVGRDTRPVLDALEAFGRRHAALLADPR